MAAAAGFLAPPERGHDRAIQRHGARVVAHAGRGARGHRVRVRPHHVHQPRARPVGGGVEAGLLGLRPCLAIGRERRIDQPRVEVRDILVSRAKLAPHRERHVGDEDVGLLHQPAQHLVAALGFQVEREAALVAVIEDPGVVAVHPRRAGPRVQGAIKVTFAGRLDLDHVGAEVGEDRRCRRRRDEARAIDHSQSGKKPFGHWSWFPAQKKNPELNSGSAVHSISLPKGGGSGRGSTSLISKPPPECFACRPPLSEGGVQRWLVKMIVPEAPNMPPTPWQTEIFAFGTCAAAVPRICRTLSCSAYMPYMPECM